MVPKKTRRRTAFGLLDEIANLIAAHPRQYNQREVIEDHACGTVCCVGGWAAVLTAPTEAALAVVNVSGKAKTVLQLTTSQYYDLFGAGAAGDNGQGHAKRGVRHIRRFQQANSAQLKATKLSVTIPLAWGTK